MRERVVQKYYYARNSNSFPVTATKNQRMSQDDGVPQLQEGRVAQNSINGCALSFWPPKCSGLISERAGAVAELRLEILLYVHFFWNFVAVYGLLC